MSDYPIEAVEGIGPSYGNKLEEAGIKTTAAFLDKCASKKGRQAVAEETGISEKLILTWANLADLMRINGVGPQFAELLEASGVDTVKELAQRNPVNLAAKMKGVNDEKNLAKAEPSSSMVAQWVAEADTMQPLITH